MSLLRNNRIRELFAELQDRDPASRRLALDSDPTIDPEIRSEVESLLDQHDKISGFLSRPALGAGFVIGTPEARALATPLLPDRIGVYTIIKVLGEGGMGVVYLAEQERPKRLVALKVVRPGLSTPSILRRFEHEAEILARLEHPGIARIYEAGCADAGFGPQPFFAMELVGGVPLDCHARVHELDHRARLDLIARVCDAVHHAHQKGIVHRDLKPANILVEPSGQPRILDFGVARAIGTDDPATGPTTQSGELVGTLPYMSPEQLSGDPRDVDVRADVYALGVVAYELLAGRLPLAIPGTSLVEATRLVREVEPARLGTLDRRFRGDVEAIVSTALEKDKNARYASASELGADIRRHLAREPIVARPAGRLLRLRRWARRNPALAALFVVLAVGVCVLAVMLEITNDALESEARQKQVAQRRGEDLRQLAEAAIFQIHDSIKDVAGATETRSRLLDLAVTRLEALSEEAPSGEQTRSRARAWGVVGDLQGQPTHVNLGNASSALASYARETGILQRLASDEPLRDWAAWELTSVELRRSNVLQSIGRTAEAVETAQRALEQRERLAAAHPENPAAPRMVTAARSVVLTLLVKTGSYANMEDLATRIVRENETAAAAAGDENARLDLAKALAALGTVALFTRADATVGLGHLRHADAVLDSLLASRPFSVEALSSKGGVLADMAYALDLAADFERAAQAADESIRQYDRLCAADSADVYHVVRLAGVHLRKSSIHRRAGKPAEAEASARAARAVLDRLRSPALEDSLRFVRANAERDFAAAIADQGRSAEALDAYGRSMAILNEAIAADPRHEGLKVALANDLVQVGRLRSQNGQDREAWEPPFSRARELLAPGSAASPEVAGQLFACEVEWGRAERDFGESAAAKSHFEEARGGGERLLREAPDSARMATDLAETIYELARVAYRENDPAGAIRSLERATEVAGGALLVHPGDPEVRKCVGRILSTHAKLLAGAPLESDPADIPAARLVACARVFLEAPPECGRNPFVARSYASRAVAATKRVDPESLVLLAEAAAACRDREQAQALATEALALAPSVADSAKVRFQARISAILEAPASRAESH